jgi:hypothetical protein
VKADISVEECDLNPNCSSAIILFLSMYVYVFMYMYNITNGAEGHLPRGQPNARLHDERVRATTSRAFETVQQPVARLHDKRVRAATYRASETV